MPEHKTLVERVEELEKTVELGQEEMKELKDLLEKLLEK